MPKPLKALITLIVVALGFVGGMVWTADATAKKYGYDPAFGKPVAVVGGVYVYRPDMPLRWLFRFEKTPVYDTLNTNIYLGLLGMIIPLGILFPLFLRQKKAGSTIHGASRFADEAEVKKMGLLKNKGVIIGKYKQNYMTHDGPEHLLAFAPTRSGKGVGLVVPSLIAWSGSAIVHDLKGENWELTAGYRKHLGPVLYFNPGDQASVHFNPLFEVRLGENEVKDTQMIADILVDPEGASERMDHWAKTGHALLVGSILHVLYSKDIHDKSLKGVADLLSNPNKSAEDVFNEMLNAFHFELGEHPIYQSTTTHPVVAACAREMLNKAENERSGVISTAMSFLSLYRDPIVAGNTAESDFRIEDLMDGEQPVSLYLVVPPPDAQRTKSLMRLMLQQICRRLTERLKKPKHRMLLMLDEFPALGRLDFFETALAYVAGYGLKAYLITQSLNQLEKAYGQNNSIMDNCHIRITFAPNDERTAKRISELLGTTTVASESTSESGKKMSWFLSQKSKSVNWIGRPLMTPGEIMQIPPDRELIFIANQPPILAWKMRFYEDKKFGPLTNIKPPESPRFQKIRTITEPIMDGLREGAVSREIPPAVQIPDRAGVTEAANREPEASREAVTRPAATETPIPWETGVVLCKRYGDAVVEIDTVKENRDGIRQRRREAYLPREMENDDVINEFVHLRYRLLCIERDMFFGSEEEEYAIHGFLKDVPRVFRFDVPYTENRDRDVLAVLDTLAELPDWAEIKAGERKASPEDAGLVTETAPVRRAAEGPNPVGLGQREKGGKVIDEAEQEALRNRLRVALEYRGISIRKAGDEMGEPTGRRISKFLNGNYPLKATMLFTKRLTDWIEENEPGKPARKRVANA
jgi:type IV secretion system protein VirD4